ncbi:RNA polymerase sigma factor [Membranicola marinus]|uniref:RNA polymerase sigma factor n=1 Tax=Membranihabitans marinus TaxID=1227546 RepID=A0A953HLB3_9BACT|nr:RNA polymerase sigma factor [Membranihabitans marinus]MBY5958029.1 RNA polymerase sigma factor [Membranihabitans marinus]
MTPTEYNECVDDHADQLFRYCTGLTRNRTDADDLVQTAFAKLWENRKDLEKKVAKSWLYRTAYRSMVDEYRKTKRNQEYRNRQEEQATEFQSSIEDKDLIRKALDVLTDEQKNLILLRDYEGYSYKELCDITEMSMSNVKTTLFRSRKKLKEKLLELDFKI